MSVAVKPRLALVGDQYNHDEPSHPRIEKLMPELGVAAEWVPTTEITDGTDFTAFDGIWVVPGGPYRAQQGVHHAIRFARESKSPLLGTCGGFFSTVLEQAQNILKLPEAVDLGDDLKPIEHLILPSACSINTEHRVRLDVRRGSRLSAIYGYRTEVDEILQCQDGVVQDFMDRATQGGSVRFCAWDPAGAPKASEITSHPFFLGCLFQPELSSTADSVHPIIAAFLAAIRDAAEAREAGSTTARGAAR